MWGLKGGRSAAAALPHALGRQQPKGGTVLGVEDTSAKGETAPSTTSDAIMAVRLRQPMRLNGWGLWDHSHPMIAPWSTGVYCKGDCGPLGRDGRPGGTAAARVRGANVAGCAAPGQPVARAVAVRIPH